MGDTDENTTACTYLTKPLNFSELLGSGCNFEINANFHDDMIMDLNLSSDDDNDEDAPIDIAKLVSPWTKSFDELKLNMMEINPYMWKRVIKTGYQNQPVVDENCRVSIRYNAYWEGETAPFDSSVLKGAPYSFYTGCNEVLEGLEVAIRTMHPNEESHFIISYHMLFREMGCPPRIKPKADALFIIELVTCIKVGDINAEQKIPIEDRNKYSRIRDSVMEIKTKAKDFYCQKMYRNAIRSFDKAVSLLRYCRVADEKEEKECHDLLIVLYTNLAVCYNQIDNPGKCCIMCREIRNLTNNCPSVKALFQEGRALLKLADFEEARQILLRAQKLSPDNAAVHKEIKLLDERYKSYKNNERELCQRAMQVMQISEEDKNKKLQQQQYASNMNSFEETLREQLEAFKTDETQHEFKLVPGLHGNEIKCIRNLAETMNLKLITNTLDRSKYIITKVANNNMR